MSTDYEPERKSKIIKRELIYPRVASGGAAYSMVSM